jgi:sulfite reductase (ferredoxin)
MSDSRILTAAIDAAAAQTPKRSPVEEMKEKSRQLRGSIVEVLASPADHFGESDKNLLKFHGSYQQEDRDARKNRSKQGVGKHYMFMVRCKMPGGKLTAAQYLALDDLAGQFGNATIRFTSRQGIQFHGVLKEHLKDTIAGINACLLSTLGACGDVERNVMACPAPHDDGLHGELQHTADLLAAHLAPRTRAYHEVWLNGQPLEDPAGKADIEPLYGKTYLPRKFKTGLALPEDNCIDIYAQDLGLLAIVEQGQIAGYNVLVGGGMGMTHGNANTFPHLAQPICYVPARAVVGAAEAVVKLFRDHGNRSDRKRARIKYLVHDWGVDKFRQMLSEYIGAPLVEPRPVKVSAVDLHLGWHEQGNSECFYGVSVENGRVKDEGSLRLRSGLRAIVNRFRPYLRVTPMQDLLICGLDATARPELEKLLDEHGISRPEQVSNVQRLSMSCPAVPTCGLAISESERVLPGIIDQLEEELERLGLANEKIGVRMTGCPNGCVRPYQSDIGLVGRSGDKYTVFVGGHELGHRLNFMLQDLVPLAGIVPTLVPLLRHFKTDRLAGERFGDYCQRLGAERLRALSPTAGEDEQRDGQERDGEPTSPNGDGVPGREPVAVKQKVATAESRFVVARPRGALRALTDESALGDGSQMTIAIPPTGAKNALTEPQTQAVPLAIAEPQVITRTLETGQPSEESETYFQGGRGEERRDYSYCFDSQGNVRTTLVYFYGSDQRAASAQKCDPLRRKATYQGRVDPLRLYFARKLSDTFYAGPAGQERRDVRIEYHAEGRPARTVVFFYEGGIRAAEAPPGSALQRQAVYSGLIVGPGTDHA